MNQTHFTIESVKTESEMEKFLMVSSEVYKNDPYWVQPLGSSIKKQLAPDNSFLEYGQHQPFIAVSTTSGQPLGRIVVAINQRLIARENQQIGLFGYFECINDYNVAQALLATAGEWLRDRHIQIIRGPINLSTHNDCLFLVDGFNTPPFMMMPYNQAYYCEFMEKAGFEKAQDAYAYDLDLSKPLPDKYEKGYKIACKSGINFRPLRIKGEGFQEDCRSLYRLFTDAFANNWSSTPRTEEEFLEEAQDLQSLVDPALFPIAEDEGKMIGFWMALPNYNIALKHINGKLNWLGILKFLWYRRQINQARVIAMCSLPEYRRKMVPLALIYLGFQGGTSKTNPYTKAELSYVWEDNISSRKIIEATGASISKTYRIYQKNII